MKSSCFGLEEKNRIFQKCGQTSLHGEDLGVNELHHLLSCHHKALEKVSINLWVTFLG